MKMLKTKSVSFGSVEVVFRSEYDSERYDSVPSNFEAEIRCGDKRIVLSEKEYIEMMTSMKKLDHENPPGVRWFA